MNKKSKSRKKSKTKAKNRRNIKLNEQYKAKIDTINTILNEYYRTFGKRGLEYNNLMVDVEKLLGSNNSIFFNHGSESTAAHVSKNLVYSTNKRNARYKITRIYNHLLNKPNAASLVNETYGYRKISNDVIKSVKSLSALKKLENDALPNYYSALDNVTNSKMSMKFRKEFSRLKGLKRNSKEYAEIYEDIGNQIKEYLREIGNQAQEIIDELKEESIFDEYYPTTISDLLKR